MILNIITFVTCLLMLILFRKLDKSNTKMAKLRRYSARVFDNFKKVAETEYRKFKDATIEMDILIKKSNSLAKNLTASLKEIETRLEGLNVEKTNLKKVEEDIRVISHAAREVNKQIEFIAVAKEDFSDISGKITGMEENIEELRRENIAIVQDFNSKVRERSRELTQEMEQRVAGTGDIILENVKKKIDAVVKSVEGAATLDSQIETLKGTLQDLENSVFEDIRVKAEEMREDLDQSAEQLYGKLSGVEKNIDDSKEKLIKTFENEVGRIRTEVDNLSIHAISKKDEIVQAARKEAEETRARIEEFDEKFNKMENSLVATADEKMRAIDAVYASIEQKNSALTEKLEACEQELIESISVHMNRVKQDFSNMEEKLAGIKEGVMNYEEQIQVFARTDQMMQEVNDSIEKYQGMLEVSKQEARNLEKYFEDLEHLKDMRKAVDREIRSFQGKKDRLAEVENDIRGLLELSDIMMKKTDMLRENSAKVDIVNSRIDALAETYTDLDSRINELMGYDESISRNLDSISRTDLIVKSMDGKVKTVQNIVERADKRVEKISQHLQKVEEETLILKTRDSEIQDVRDKFNELDGLSALIEKRIEQIYAMFQKLETLRKEVDETDYRLQEMYSETDKKMKQFVDFIQAVDRGNPISRQVNSEAPLAKNMNKNIIKTVRELSDKGWGPDEISKKLMIDENSVRLIINTTSM